MFNLVKTEKITSNFNTMLLPLIISFIATQIIKKILNASQKIESAIYPFISSFLII